jgi:hypothetical protein
MKKVWSVLCRVLRAYWELATKEETEEEAAERRTFQGP